MHTFFVGGFVMIFLNTRYSYRMYSILKSGHWFLVSPLIRIVKKNISPSFHVLMITEGWRIIIIIRQVEQSCPAYASLREGLNIDNDLDVVHYIQNVFKIQESMNSLDWSWLWLWTAAQHAETSGCVWGGGGELTGGEAVSRLTRLYHLWTVIRLCLKNELKNLRELSQP